ncbi:uncharacterized protein LOC110100903 [Dendrobium catenatum]|uniref:uncharacterized protein LOC110100903 n=1 Tax=Dendrobium catenatum TaxID=906689 RepID=UPI0010A0046D|nr:uncharacterized protein LOC110100903 [Dendrobium catenatum]
MWTGLLGKIGISSMFWPVGVRCTLEAGCCPVCGLSDVESSASKDYHSRRALWNDIGSLINAEDQVLVGGDFNCCLAQEEKKGGRCFTYSVGAQEMANFMSDNDLHDLGFSGPKFTWSNNKSGSSKIWVRLDRVQMNTEGLRLAPLATVKHLVRLASDHFPLLLSLNSSTRSRGSNWLLFEDAEGTVLLEPQSKELGELKSSLEARIAWLQEVECSSVGLSAEQDGELRHVAGELIAALARLATWWRQIAKTRWIEEGDANSHFFHSNASTRRRSNTIREIKDQNGETITDQKLIRDEFWSFFLLKWKERQVSLNDWPEFREDEKIHPPPPIR